jgi:hypothetical protein
MAIAWRVPELQAMGVARKYTDRHLKKSGVAIREPSISENLFTKGFGFRAGVRVMITIGSVSREAAAARFPFLAENFSGRRKRIKEFTHHDPDFVFWIYPDGRLHDARRSHRDNVPRGYDSILDDEPDYGGFLRGRVASQQSDRLIVVYCRPEALATPGAKLNQFLRGVERLPVPIDEKALVVSDNADLYGTLADLRDRERIN